jgi:hypothetical protein
MELETVIKYIEMYEIVNPEIPELEPSNPGISGLRKKSGIPGLESTTPSFKFTTMIATSAVTVSMEPSKSGRVRTLNNLWNIRDVAVSCR